MNDFWSPYALGGAAARPDSFSGMSDQFQQSLRAMLEAAPPEVRLGITSGYRSPETQQRLWDEALAKYGSPEAARKWVAPPGKSQHNHGHAADLKYLSPEAQKWVHENASQYGLSFPLAHEPWHVEYSGAREGMPDRGRGLTASLGEAGAALSAPAPSDMPQQTATATRQPPRWVPMTTVQFTPLELPARRRRA